MSSVRLFIAVDFSDEVAAGAAAVAGQMRRTLEVPGTRITWVKPGNLHLTLKFLGDTDEELVPEAIRALDAAADVHAAFTVRVRGAGGFPDLRRPSVLWLALAEGGDRMVRLAGDVERALVGAGFPRDERTFTPHLTVGRVRIAGRGADFAAACARVDDRDAGACGIDRVTLYRSTLNPDGPAYTALRQCRLGGNKRNGTDQKGRPERRK